MLFLVLYDRVAEKGYLTFLNNKKTEFAHNGEITDVICFKNEMTNENLLITSCTDGKITAFNFINGEF